MLFIQSTQSCTFSDYDLGTNKLQSDQYKTVEGVGHTSDNLGLIIKYVHERNIMLMV